MYTWQKNTGRLRFFLANIFVGPFSRTTAQNTVFYKLTRRLFQYMRWTCTRVKKFITVQSEDELTLPTDASPRTDTT